MVDRDRPRAPVWPHWVAGTLLVVLGAVLALAVFGEEYARATIEARMNAALDGFSVTIDAAELNPLAFSATLKALTITQDAYPDTPVVDASAVQAGVEWRMLLRGRLVADMRFDAPVVHIDIDQLGDEIEAVDPAAPGWRDALGAAHFLDLNRIDIHDGEIEVIDAGVIVLHATEIVFTGEHMARAGTPGDPYPSPFRLAAEIGGARGLLVGHADFLADPFPSTLATLDFDTVHLDHFSDALARVGVILTGGVADGSAELELAPGINRLNVTRVAARDVRLDYVYSNGAENENDDAEPGEHGDDGNNGDRGNDETGNDDENDDNADNAADAVEDIVDGPDPWELDLRIDDLLVTGELGFVNESADPAYRLFLTDTTFTLTGYSNRFAAGPAQAHLQALFMGSGDTRVAATFRPEQQGPDFDLSVEIRDTHLPALNDLLEAYANIDVSEGNLSFFSELTIQDGHVDGYLRPLIGDLEVHDPEDDEDQGPLEQLYEMAVGAIGTILENIPREEIATQADISGPLDDPDMSTWEIIAGLIQNAFFQAILPGFDAEVGD